MKKLFLVMPLLMASGVVKAADASEGYYGSLKYLQLQQNALEMDNSARPGVGSFTGGNDKDHFANAALALGYQWGNGWRSEAEYTFAKGAEYTSGSSVFTGSYNHLQLNVQRLMLNAYRDYAIGHNFSVYGSAGIGISAIRAGGWQGMSGRQYDENRQNNLTWSLGAGMGYTVTEQLTVDMGYRYIDMGKIESGYNNFTNARLLKDEQMKAHLTENQFSLGLRYIF